jgi:hypothetical protein
MLYGFVFQWSRVWIFLESLDTYMIVNFRVGGISQDAHKLARTSLLKKKKVTWSDKIQLVTLLLIAQLLKMYIK